MTDQNSPSVISVGPIPVSAADPKRKLWEWRNEAIRFLNALAFDRERTAARASASAGSTDLLTRTRQRLNQLTHAQTENLATLTEILQPLLNHPELAGVAAASPRAPLPNSLRLAENFSNLFRDWAWPSVEPEAHYKAVTDQLQSVSKGKVLVLGGGTGRLGYDLARRGDWDEVVVTEINTLLFLIGERVVSGHKVNLFEVAELPGSLALSSERRILKADAPRPPNLKFCLTDFLEDRLPAGDFDVVVTPWFIDVVQERTARVLQKINRLLRPGGLWVHVGPLMFQSHDRAQLLTVEEVHELATVKGFKIRSSKNFWLTQLRSPLSASFRTDQVYQFSAEKVAEAEEDVSLSADEPSFLRDPYKPVEFPTDVEEAAQSYHLIATILQGCADKKTPAQMAKELAPDFGLPESSVLQIVLSTIREHYKLQRYNPLIVTRG